MEKPNDPVTVVFDRSEAVALTDADENHYSLALYIRARQRIREALGTEPLHRAAKAHRESRGYW